MVKKILKKIILYSILIFISFVFLNVVMANNGLLLDSGYKSNIEAYESWLTYTANESNLISNEYQTQFNLKTTMNSIIQSRVNSKNSAASDKFDLRDVIQIDVKSQGTTNTCWAFAAIGAVETNMSLVSGYGYSNKFSPRHMEYATSQSFTDGFNEKGFNREINQGGNPNVALPYLTNGMGLVLEEDMPFEETTEEISLSEIEKESVAYVKEYKRFATVNKKIENGVTKNYKSDGTEYTSTELQALRDEIKTHIVTYGGLIANTYIGDEYFNNENFRWATAYYCNDDSVELNHQVVIIGWDDNYSRENFNEENRPSSDGAYLVLNSYGEDYLGGCYYISYEDVLIEKDLVGIVNTAYKDYKNLYQYDELGASVSFKPTLENLELGSGEINELYATNIFDKKDLESEIITEIGLTTLDEVTVDVYVLPDASTLDLSGATLVASNVSLNSGYKTITLSSPIEITGNNFAIIVKYKDSDELKIPLEANPLGNEHLYPISSLWNTATARPGQSMYSLTGNQGEWYEINNISVNTNFCIKAFTTGTDEEGPSIEFETNGNEIADFTQSTIVNVSDENGVNKSTLKYLWTQSTIAPDKSEFVNTFSNGEEITIEEQEGTWYLWIIAADMEGNETIQRSEGFELELDLVEPPTLISDIPSGQYTNDDVVIQVIPGDTEGDYTYKYSINNGDTWNNVPSNMQIKIDRTRETEVVAKATNARGKDSEFSNTYIVKINKTKPVVNGVSDAGIYKTDVTPIISDDLSYTIKLEKDGEQISYIENNPISDSGSYVLTVTDEAGNEIVVNFVIDKEVPTISFNPNGNTFYQKEQSSMINISKDSNISNLKYLWTEESENITEEILNEEGQTYINHETVTKSDGEGIWYLWAMLEDQYGNVIIKRSEAFYFDNTKPSISFEYDDSTSQIYAKSHSVTVNVSDTTLNNDELKYVWTQNAEEPEANEFTNTFINGQNITKNTDSGDWYLWIYAIDEAGNTTVNSSKVLKLDNQIPGKPELSANIENGAATKNEVIINVSGGSTVSGIKRYEFSLNNGQTWNELNVGEALKASNEAKYNLLIRAVNNVDTAGENSEEFAFTIDKTAPEISYPIEGEEYIEVTPVIEDDLEFTVQLKRNGTEENYTYNNSIVANGNYELTAIDEAGNSSTVNFTIKNEAPEIAFGTNGNSTYGKEQKTTVNVTDEDLDESTLKYIWTQSTNEPEVSENWISFTNGDEIVKNTESGTWYLWVQAADERGNKTVERSKEFNLDNDNQAKPNISANIEKGEATKEEVTITLNAEETVSGLAKYVYSINGGTNWNDVEGDTISFSTEGKYTVIAKAINNVGTESENSEEFTFTIDKTAPVIKNIEDGTEYEEVSIEIEESNNYKIVLIRNGEEVQYTEGETITEPGVYSITVIDEANNQTSISFSIKEKEVPDTQGPIVSFENNGNEKYEKSHTTKVNITDISGIDEISLKYIWKTDTTIPDEEEFVYSFQNGDEIILENVSGKYYLWIMAKDTLGNTTITRSNVFYIDNTTPNKPTVEVNKNEENNTVTITVSGSTSESEVTYQYTLDNGITWNNLEGNEITISDVGTTNISFRAINEVENVSEITDNIEVIIEEDDNNQEEENPDDNNDGDDNENIIEPEDPVGSNEEGEDNTVSKDPLPQAGIYSIVLPIIILSSIIACIVYVKNKHLV